MKLNEESKIAVEGDEYRPGPSPSIWCRSDMRELSHETEIAWGSRNEHLVLFRLDGRNHGHDHSKITM